MRPLFDRVWFCSRAAALAIRQPDRFTVWRQWTARKEIATAILLRLCFNIRQAFQPGALKRAFKHIRNA
jgi:hypothetical protein